MADTTHLTLEEHGAYFKLLMVAWRTEGCALPDDDARIARILGITPGRWAKLKPVVMAFWTLDNGAWTQKRLSKEREFVARKSSTNSRAAKARWDAQVTENIEGEACERISERNAPPPPPPPTVEERRTGESSSTAGLVRKGAVDADAIWDNVELAHHLTRIAGVRHIDPNAISRNIEAVAEWVEAGADPPLLAETIQTVRDATTTGIHSLKYFDGRIRKAIAKRDHPNAKRPDHPTENIRDPLLRRWLENGGTLAT